MNESTDRIEREILLNAPRSRVWRALSNAEEFGDWFGVALKGKIFAAGKRVQGQITHPGYEHVVWDVLIERLEPERLLSWRWHPAAVEPSVDYSKEPTTLVVFELKEVEGGTLLSVVKVGRERLWEFEPTQLEEARRSLEVIGRQWDNALNKLKMAVES